MYPNDEAKFDAIVASDMRWMRDILSSWMEIDDKVGTLRKALGDVPLRNAALRLLLLLGDDVKKGVFAELIDLASVGHSDIGLCRTVIKSLPRDWVLRHVETEVDKVLTRVEDEEAYRRFAELYCELDKGLLDVLLFRVRKSSDAEIREIADDFETNPH